jgi:hypothetical protein
MADRLHEAREPSDAVRKKRLVDFNTGKADLQPEHTDWLDETLRFLPAKREFWIWVYGYASKRGFHGERDPNRNEGRNTTLSIDRANAVVGYLEARNRLITPRVRRFIARGNKSYVAPAGDDSPEERAVEVHIFLDEEPPIPPDLEEPPCYGGKRYRKWAIATPFGITGTALPGLLVAAANIVVFRRLEGPQVDRAYMAPALGPGDSWTGPTGGKLWEAFKAVFGKLNFSGMSFSKPVTAVTPFNFGDLHGASYHMESVSGGVVVTGYMEARFSASGPVWFRGSDGKCMRATRELVKMVDVSGKNLNLGIGASAVGGVLLELG